MRATTQERERTVHHIAAGAGENPYHRPSFSLKYRLLRQLWRVLAPEGKLLLVAPNRASLWAQVEWSPFGQGRPFSRRELENILRDVLFVPTFWDRALFVPPFNSRALIGTGASWERLGQRFAPGLGGVHLVEATKSLYAPVGPTPVASTARAFRGAETTPS